MRGGGRATVVAAAKAASRVGAADAAATAAIADSSTGLARSGCRLGVGGRSVVVGGLGRGGGIGRVGGRGDGERRGRVEVHDAPRSAARAGSPAGGGESGDASASDIAIRVSLVGELGALADGAARGGHRLRRLGRVGGLHVVVGVECLRTRDGVSDATVSSIDAPIAAAGAGGSAGSSGRTRRPPGGARRGEGATVSSIDPNGAAASGGSAVSEWS